jgi:hypothetical protein
MDDTTRSMTLHVKDGGRRFRLSIEPPLDLAPWGIGVSLDETSSAFQALSQAWGKSLTQTETAYVLCAPIILNWDECAIY